MLNRKQIIGLFIRTADWHAYQKTVCPTRVAGLVMSSVCNYINVLLAGSGCGGVVREAFWQEAGAGEGGEGRTRGTHS